MKLKVGIPRSLLYFYYFPAWKAFFDRLGVEIILSPSTNKKILDRGVKLAIDDLCLPFKAYFGHVSELIENKNLNYLFIPRLISLGNNDAVCPKFMGLPDMIKSMFKESPPILEPEIDLTKKFFPLRRIFYGIGRKLKFKLWEIEKAYQAAIKRQKEFENILENGNTFHEGIRIIENRSHTSNNSGAKSSKYEEENSVSDIDRNLTVAVMGHSYIINDNHLSLGIIQYLRELGVSIITHEMVNKYDREKASRIQGKTSFWFYNRQIMGAAYHLMNKIKNRIDGVIQVTSFGCGPDSLVKELVSLKFKNDENSYLLNLDLDEHSGKAGLITRLEAFIDLLERRKENEKGNLPSYG
ncbi:MAG: acyl-CoA dehydratase activase-related protein [Bacillota bacterium]